MKKRDHKPTSKLGENHIAPHKESHKEKILAALKAMKVGGNHEQIAEQAGLRPDQVWKRLSELEKEGKIFNTGLMRALKSHVPGIVWNLKKSAPSQKMFTPTVNLQQQLF